MTGPPSKENGFLLQHATLLQESHTRLIGRPLITDQVSPAALGEAIFNADFVVLSSGTEPDPLFNYANRTALKLFELDWETLCGMPARESAESVHQDTRAALMQQVTDNGFIEDYSGVRISAGGRRFMIELATVWNVVDAAGRLHGQAATFKDWRYLSAKAGQAAADATAICRLRRNG
jgi:hypothetical protein